MIFMDKDLVANNINMEGWQARIGRMVGNKYYILEAALVTLFPSYVIKFSFTSQHCIFL
ncbi:hypothetical protein JHK82_031474 [Glycine max]|uniref:Uncharacterized protein n=1 Tax=Glycine max TaxID=3847 RepID=A0A0R0HHX3_SOYBN|nr:hypothetical protein JHK87_031395 [Glycine soja]KAG4989147.1 hypothetical protein JHK85_032130 [Glycine max]KAG4994736.1 hypothetical protein JHK86_031563 [Glycine max]KAG5124737.1 hypothetical protein JHK82_031474 [Glycine max]KAG5146157.1 hypothetical protein JHK84_031700 [Glycine max]